MAAVGFEPTPPKRLVPKTSALDRSATLPTFYPDKLPKFLYQNNAFLVLTIQIKFIMYNQINQNTFLVLMEMKISHSWK